MSKKINSITLGFVIVLAIFATYQLSIIEPAYAAVSVKKGSFAKCTTNPCTDSINVGFSMSGSPSVLFLWTTKQTAEGLANQGFYSLGFTDGTNHRTIAMAGTDASPTSNSAKIQRNAKCLTILASGTSSNAPAIDATCSFTSTGFDITWNPNTANAYLIHYLAVGGLTNVEVGDLAIGTVTGNLEENLSGAFQPDFVMMMDTRDINGDRTTSDANGAMNVGAFTGSAEDGSVSTVIEDGRTTPDSWNWQRQDSVITSLTPTTGAVNGRASFVTMDSDGFTINRANAWGNNDVIFYVAVKGGQWTVNEFQRPTSTGTQDITTVGFEPKAYLLFSDGSASLNPATASSDAFLTFSGSDGTSEGSASVSEEDAADPEDNYDRYTTAKAYEAHLDTDGSVAANADHSAFLSNGFRLDWTTVSATAVYVFYIAVGDVAAAPSIAQNTGCCIFSIDPITQYFSDAIAYLINQLTITDEKYAAAQTVPIEDKKLPRLPNVLGQTMLNTVGRIQLDDTITAEQQLITLIADSKTHVDGLPQAQKADWQPMVNEMEHSLEHLQAYNNSKEDFNQRQASVDPLIWILENQP